MWTRAAPEIRRLPAHVAARADDIGGPLGDPGWCERATYLLVFGKTYPHFHALITAWGADVPEARRLPVPPTVGARQVYAYCPRRTALFSDGWELPSVHNKRRRMACCRSDGQTRRWMPYGTDPGGAPAKAVSQYTSRNLLRLRRSGSRHATAPVRRSCPGTVISSSRPGAWCCLHAGRLILAPMEEALRLGSAARRTVKRGLEPRDPLTDSSGFSVSGASFGIATSFTSR